MFPLTLHHLVWRMLHVHHGSEVVDVAGGVDDPRVHRQSFGETARRAASLAAELAAWFGTGPGSTVAVLAFNTREHLETLLAAPLLGAAVNSLNPRLATDRLTAQAQDPYPQVALVDAELVNHPVLGEGARQVLGVYRARGVPLIVVGDGTGTTEDCTVAYETLASAGTPLEPAGIGEDSVAFHFHTSGTTGPSTTHAVTHRAAVLHSLSQATADATGLTPADRVLPLAPFFHVNGWGLPLTCALTGASLVLTGGDLDPVRIATVLRREQVTLAAGVPTVWHDICGAVAAGAAGRPTALREVISGGSAVPESVVRAVRETLGARVTSSWGMTETMSCSTFERSDPSGAAGRPIPLIETRLAGLDGETEHRTGEQGRLQVRGALVVGLADSGDSGWFDTGDIASIDPEGRLSLHDREKDLIKSGGEWIVSAQLEQRLCTHPRVTAAAVVATPHPRWMERPVAYVSTTASETDPEPAAALRDHLAAAFPKWWLPDRIVFVDELPRTAVGKIDKRLLRTRPVIGTTEDEVLT